MLNVKYCEQCSLLILLCCIFYYMGTKDERLGINSGRLPDETMSG